MKLPSPYLPDYSGASNQLARLGQQFGENRRRNMLAESLPAAQQGDQDALARVYQADPATGLKLQQGLAEQARVAKQDEAAAAKDRRELMKADLKQAAGTIVNLNETDLPMYWPQIRASLVQRHPELAEMPVDYDPSVLATAKSIAAKAGILPEGSAQGSQTKEIQNYLFGQENPEFQRMMDRRRNQPSQPKQYAPKWETMTLPDGRQVQGWADPNTGKFMAAGEPFAAPKSGSRGGQLPATLVKEETTDLDAMSGMAGVNADLATFEQMIRDGNLELGPVRNIESRGRNYTGRSDETSRNYQSLQSNLERLRNASLRLNKGIQTEGDAQRAWNELLTNLNDEKNVLQRLGEIQRVNERGLQIRQGFIDVRRQAYGADPLDASQFIDAEPTVGYDPDTPSSSQVTRRASPSRSATTRGRSGDVPNTPENTGMYNGEVDMQTAPDGVDQEVWNMFTPEEKVEFLDELMR